jgi:hypothetical protein
MSVFSRRLFKICRGQQSNSAFGQRLIKFGERDILMTKPPIGFRIPVSSIVLPGEINIAQK